MNHCAVHLKGTSDHKSTKSQFLKKNNGSCDQVIRGTEKMQRQNCKGDRIYFQFHSYCSGTQDVSPSYSQICPEKSPVSLV